jgi:hypothetical protein
LSYRRISQFSPASWYSRIWPCLMPARAHTHARKKVCVSASRFWRQRERRDKRARTQRGRRRPPGRAWRAAAGDYVRVAGGCAKGGGACGGVAAEAPRALVRGGAAAVAKSAHAGGRAPPLGTHMTAAP